uniref:Ig-like domain-containing protein n=1 Tax=Zosterops lateralis melanops TaxID=1220523 RepID=A0A8D2QRS0_ZOSLA
MGKNEEIIPPAVAIFSPSKQEIQQKSKATLVCLASGFYPDHLTLRWRVNGVERTEGVGTDESSTKNGSTYSLTSRLRIPAWQWFDPANRFECVASFFQNETMQSMQKFIHGDAGCALREGTCGFSRKENFASSLRQLSVCIFIPALLTLNTTCGRYLLCE